MWSLLSSPVLLSGRDQNILFHLGTVTRFPSPTSASPYPGTAIWNCVWSVQHSPVSNASKGSFKISLWAVVWPAHHLLIESSGSRWYGWFSHLQSLLFACLGGPVLCCTSLSTHETDLSYKHAKLSWASYLFAPGILSGFPSFLEHSPSSLLTMNSLDSFNFQLKYHFL